MAAFIKFLTTLIPSPRASDTASHGILAATGVVALTVKFRQDKGKEQRLAALEKRIGQLEQAKAALSGFYPLPPSPGYCF
jgi:hypothetical protein